MANNVTFQAATVATPPSATVVETIDEGSGVERQVVCIGGIGKAGSETQIGSSIPVSFGAASIARVKAAGGAPAAVAIKGAAGTIYGWSLYNNKSSAPIFLKFYNKAAASVTVGTDVPAFTIGIPPGAPNLRSMVAGASFSTAMSYAITGGIADTDTTAVSADDLHGEIEWT